MGNITNVQLTENFRMRITRRIFPPCVAHPLGNSGYRNRLVSTFRLTVLLDTSATRLLAVTLEPLTSTLYARELLSAAFSRLHSY